MKTTRRPIAAATLALALLAGVLAAPAADAHNPYTRSYACWQFYDGPEGPYGGTNGFGHAKITTSASPYYRFATISVETDGTYGYAENCHVTNGIVVGAAYWLYRQDNAGRWLLVHSEPWKYSSTGIVGYSATESYPCPCTHLRLVSFHVVYDQGQRIEAWPIVQDITARS